MKFLLPIVFLISTSASANVLCKIYDDTVNYGVEIISTTLDCTNTDTIRSDLKNKLSRYNICTDSVSFMDNTNFCKRVSTFVINEMKGKIPTNWGCTVTQIENSLDDKINRFCSNQK